MVNMSFFIIFSIILFLTGMIFGFHLIIMDLGFPDISDDASTSWGHLSLVAFIGLLSSHQMYLIGKEQGKKD